MKGRWHIATILLGFILFGGISFAEEKIHLNRRLVTEEKKLEDIKRQLRETKKTVKQIKGKERGILKELEELNKRLAQKKREIKRIDESLKKTSAELDRTAKRILRLEREKRRLRGLLEKRLRGLYKMRNGGMMRMIFTEGGSLDVTKRYRYLSVIMEHDRKLISDIKENLLTLDRERARLEHLRAELTERRKERRKEKKKLEQARKKRALLLASIRKEKKSYLKLMEELRASKNNLSRLIKKLKKESRMRASGFALMKGRLPMPVRGKVVSFYGKVVHPKFKTVTFNNGIVIKAPYGTGVKSIYSGRVVYVGWLRGYGRVIIIDNGGGYYTLFAYLSEVFKKKGDMVKKGDIIGLVGDSGPHEGAALYFEIRERGIPRDPLAWISSKKK